MDNFLSNEIRELVSNKVARNIEFCVNQHFEEARKYGESKFLAKIEAKKNGANTVTGMYSKDTEKSYRKHAKHVIGRVIANHPEVRTVSDIIPHIKEEIESEIKSGVGAYSIRLRVAACVTALGVDNYHSFGIVSLPPRSVHECKRTRTRSISDKKLVGEKYDNIRKAIEATGARRGGLKRLTESDLFIDNDGNLRVKLLEKGGKKRCALVHPDDADFIIEMFRNPMGDVSPNGSRYIFGKNAVPKNLTCHSHRARYAERIYMLYRSDGRYTSNTSFRCRKQRRGDCFDRGILLAVSKELGHNRLDVAAENYLYELHFNESECR